ncbi:MAG: PAS domain S-box protein [Anaerolineales bacterium]|nr:PAS domain S-box protein [Anaerolineales bacterium]
MKTLTLWNRAEMIASIGAWEWDIEHDQWNFTDGFRHIHGFPDRATLTLSDLKASAYPADLPTIEETLTAALAGQTPFASEHRTIRRDTGEVRWVQTWGEVDFDARGKPIRLSGVSQDVTERKLAELANARLAAVIESTSDAVISRDLAGNITSWNAGAETLFGYTAAEMTGTPGLQIIPPERATEYRKLVERLQRRSCATSRNSAAGEGWPSHRCLDDGFGNQRCNR